MPPSRPTRATSSGCRTTQNLEVTDEGYAAIGPIVWLAFNTKKAPLDDKRVRQAIAYAVDRDFIVNALLLGTATPTLNGIHPGSPFYDPDVNPYELDLDKANALLDEAGTRRTQAARASP